MTISNVMNVLSVLLLSIASILAAEKLGQPSNELLISQYFSLPSLSFPDANEQWGCKFYKSCEN